MIHFSINEHMSKSWLCCIFRDGTPLVSPIVFSSRAYRSQSQRTRQQCTTEFLVFRGKGKRSLADLYLLCGDAPDLVGIQLSEPQVAIRPGDNALRVTVVPGKGKLGDGPLRGDTPDLIASL